MALQVSDLKTRKQTTKPENCQNELVGIGGRPLTSIWIRKGIVYVQSISPHNNLRNMMHEEAFTRVKPEVGHFRIFGCLVYIHVPKEKRIKLDLSGKKGTFVGCNESSKAYQIYIPG
jgi:hypothetical protein